MGTGTIGYGTYYPDPASDAAKEKRDRYNKAKETYEGGGDLDWAQLYKEHGDAMFPAKNINPANPIGFGDLISDWTKKQTKANLGWETPEQAWRAGMPEGAGDWATQQANVLRKAQAPGLYNAAGMRATRDASLDDLTTASQGGLAADLQSQISREAALQASARQRQGGQVGLAASQPALAKQSLQETLEERAGRAAALGKGLSSGRSQELAEAARMQDWMLKREALSQKLLGMGLHQKGQRFELLGQYIRDKEAQSLAELNMAQQASTAEQVRNTGYIQAGAQAIPPFMSWLTGDSGGSSGGGGSDAGHEYGKDDEYPSSDEPHYDW